MNLNQLFLRGMACALACLLQGLSATAAPTPSRERAGSGFYLKENDRIVFYGDSITDQRLYTTYIETYCISRFPSRHFTFVHSGWGGDRVSGGGGGPIDVRLRRDVLAYKPTVVTVCLGMNDGGYRAFDPTLFAQYVTGYRHILDTLKRELPGVRITLLTAPAFDDVTQQPRFLGGYNSTLVVYGEAVRKLGAEYGLTVADTNAPLVSAMAVAKTLEPEMASRLIPDRVHPGPGGHLVMAAAVLKAWKAPDVVAEIGIDAQSGAVTAAQNSRITNLKATEKGVSFTHIDGALPWPVDRDPSANRDMSLALRATDLERTLNHFALKVTHLPAGKEYAIRVDGKEIGRASADELARGVDLAALADLPACVQARQVLTLTRRHNDLHFQRWRKLQAPVTRNGETPPPDILKQMDALDKQERDAVQELAKAARPQPHRVEIAAAS